MGPAQLPNAISTTRGGYRDVARRKHSAREDAIRGGRTTTPLSSAEREAYLRATAPEIVQHISQGEWTASRVLEAYIARAILAQELTNCLTEVLFAQARAEARALDEEFACTGTIRGPLHGVPVSFKDQYDIKGVDSTVGFSTWADDPSREDSLDDELTNVRRSGLVGHSQVVALVRAAGGVPIAKTNLSQTMFFFECSNPVWGRTLNPYSRTHSSGGSSGGEGALLAMDGSALGWGSDIGGSLRIPATSCGVYSLKPGAGRISVAGMQDPLRGFEGIRSVAGPMGRSVEDLELAARVVFGKTQGRSTSTGCDPAPLPYRDVALPEKLRFGYYLSDGFVKASPADQRAVRETVAALRQAGHECVAFQVPQVTDAMECYMHLVAADGFRTLTSDLGDDPVEPGLSAILLGPKLPGRLRSALAWTVRQLFGDDALARIILASRPCSDMQEYAQWIRRRDDYRRLFTQQVWDRRGFDGLITPVLALPAMPHDSCRLLAPLAGSTALYNVLGLPAGILPVTHVRAPDDTAAAEWTDARVGGGHGSALLERLLYGLGARGTLGNIAGALLWPLQVLARGCGRGRSRWGGYYDVRRMAGIPVGVQVVGRKWEEEKVVEMMKVVDHALGPRDFGPFCWREQRD
ncbi:amidase signature enzyme [Daedaleopsis nitida]|nr:amidase signature enzyme [Daedaleopsis nitida]